MKHRYLLFRRGDVYYCEDTNTRKQTRLRTSDRVQAERMVHAHNEAVLNAARSLQERAKEAGYPERFAMQALGHSSKAVHRAYARKAQVTVPPLEDYEKKKQTKPMVVLPDTAVARN